MTLSTNAQFKIKGTVYDSSRFYPMEAVSVLSSAGRGTTTDSNGHYSIEVSERDSIWFSYLGKPTVKYPVLKMNDPLHFDISIQINVTVLKEVRVRKPYYRLDSLQNRIDYAKGFNYQKPRLTTASSDYGVGFDVDEIIRMFQFRKNKYAQKFQQRLIEEEQEKFVDHRFNKPLVVRLTKLSGPALDSFMVMYRPSYAYCQMASDFEFYSYIKKCYDIFSQRNISGGMRREDN
jgi:hypothetical protein